MNHSLRKFMEHLLAESPQKSVNPFDFNLPSRIMGLDVVTSPEVPRYELPAELLPGVPWPPGFREEFNQWSRSFLGTTNLLPRGMTYVLGGHTLVIRSEDVVKISNV